MRQKGSAATVKPVDKYWDAQLGAWINVYPMKITQTYKRRTGASWRTTTKGK